MQGESGAVIVMNPKTGEILAMASFPDFDPNLFSGGIDQKNWNRLLANPEHPLENKAIQGLYAPGSIFKVVTAYAGLDQGVLLRKLSVSATVIISLKDEVLHLNAGRKAVMVKSI